MDSISSHQNPSAKLAQKPIKVVILELIDNRSGDVSRGEIVGVIQQLWRMPDGSVPARYFVSNVLSDAVKQQYLSINRHPGKGGKDRVKDTFVLDKRGIEYLQNQDGSIKSALVVTAESVPAIRSLKLWDPPPVSLRRQRQFNPVHQQLLEGMAA